MSSGSPGPNLKSAKNYNIFQTNEGGVRRRTNNGKNKLVFTNKMQNAVTKAKKQGEYQDLVGLVAEYLQGLSRNSLLPKGITANMITNMTTNMKLHIFRNKMTDLNTKMKRRSNGIATKKNLKAPTVSKKPAALAVSKATNCGVNNVVCLFRQNTAKRGTSSPLNPKTVRKQEIALTQHAANKKQSTSNP